MDEILDSSFKEFSSEAKGYFRSIIQVLNISELYWPQSIQRIQCPSPIQFYRDFVCSNIPVIIEDWPIEKWSHEYLKQSFGNGIVSVDVTPSGKGDCVIDGKYFVQPEQVKLEFGEFIDVISKEKTSHGVYYIQKQNNNFQTEFNESPLWNDVPKNIEKWGEEVFGVKADAVNLWMGDDNAYSSLHKDHYENFYCVVKGQKNFTLLPAADLYYLDQKEYQSGRFRYNKEEGEWDIVLEDSKIPWIAGNPNCEEHYLKYPDLEHTSPLHVCLKPGELLYLPSLVYHQVGQQTNEDESIIAINYWFDMKYDLRFNFYKLIENLAKKKKKNSESDNSFEKFIIT